jgi:hypothetical protein
MFPRNMDILQQDYTVTQFRRPHSEQPRCYVMLDVFAILYYPSYGFKHVTDLEINKCLLILIISGIWRHKRTSAVCYFYFFCNFSFRVRNSVNLRHQQTLPSKGVTVAHTNYFRLHVLAALNKCNVMFSGRSLPTFRRDCLRVAYSLIIRVHFLQSLSSTSLQSVFFMAVNIYQLVSG